jgi:tRNA pseudouridine55 synthase
VGHTGTLDPLATGLLPIVFGHATRLASLLSAGHKTYEATVALGQATDTDDSEGQPRGILIDPGVSREALLETLNAFRGRFDQVPPRHSAKKIGGRPAYELARREQPVALKPVSVFVQSLELVDYEGSQVRLRMTVTAGFYVRALARDLGTRLGCGGHLVQLRRTTVGPFVVGDAMSLDDATGPGCQVADRLIAPAAALPGLPAVVVTGSGLARVRHGNPIGPTHVDGGWAPSMVAVPGPIRILTHDGRLAALGRVRGALLHPVVVLG